MSNLSGVFTLWILILSNITEFTSAVNEVFAVSTRGTKVMALPCGRLLHVFSDSLIQIVLCRFDRSKFVTPLYRTI